MATAAMRGRSKNGSDCSRILSMGRWESSRRNMMSGVVANWAT